MNTPPDVILIGQKRAGTTFLRAYFDTHPGIAWDRKGYFFLSDAGYESGSYGAQFAWPTDGASVRIDVCERLAAGQVINDSPRWHATRLIGRDLGALGYPV